MKKTKLLPILALAAVLPLSSCRLFIFGGAEGADKDLDIETLGATTNTLTFALYNYYGYDGQHFTNKWLGMLDALNEHGINVTGWHEEKDAKKFQISYDKTGEKWDLPDDARIYMTNNQTWNASIQFTKPFAQYHPMAVISTCNGVEFASSPILSSGDGVNISNATMGGFSPAYRKAFADGSLRYLTAKYTAHILPIFAACVDAVDQGRAMKNADGTALSLSMTNWHIQTLSQYDALEEVDSIDAKHPTLRKLDVDRFFTAGSIDNNAASLTEWVKNSQPDIITAMYETNGTNQEADTAARRTGKKLKCGIIAPSSVNDAVQKYIDYIKGYCGSAYNVEFLQGSVTNQDSQTVVAKSLCNQGCDFLISLQDDMDRNDAIKVADEQGVYFAIAGSCQSPNDYELTKDIPHYIGSVGTSIEEEREAAKIMTNYYLECMKRRSNPEELLKYECEVKGLEYDDYKHIIEEEE